MAVSAVGALYGPQVTSLAKQKQVSPRYISEQ